MPSTRASLPCPGGYAVVVGGANVDIKVRSAQPAVPGTSNPGRAVMGNGGVGRNIAENLARLGTPTHLVAAVGQDAAGEALLEQTRAAGVDVSAVLRSAERTGTYTAVLDHTGELLVAVADMAAADALGPADLAPVTDLLRGAALVIADGNLAAPTLEHLLRTCAAAGVPCLLDPVSVPKARRAAPLLGPDHPLLAVTPNEDELPALLAPAPSESGDRGAAPDEQLRAAAAALHDRGVTHVWVRQGPRGSVLATRGREPVHLPSPTVTVQDVTGAGDAMLAAFAHALLAGADPLEAARQGHLAAALTVQSPHTVRPDLAAAMAAALAAQPVPSAQPAPSPHDERTR
ncbi:MAG TPA: carbohydrate kinase family protein [Segeticoccus sp.]|uniref:carbohydrate kinase family protein n=1 Tax=Segeticoccus sp. TaxID=2706531 RepID=UPI002D810A6B|nr:carbohydrate kinase family protein [Segeticoccus sp.]HET8602206.1 carbohydrate kinase family protein [Segeticoccus sp.]